MYLLSTGPWILFTSRYTVCWFKMGGPSSAATSWLSYTGAQHTLPPWWVCTLYFFLLIHIDFVILIEWSPISTWQGSLKTVELNKNPCSSINGLVSSFVTLLQVPSGPLWAEIIVIELVLLANLKLTSLVGTVRLTHYLLWIWFCKSICC